MKIKAFTSDLHFGHKNIISFCDRPYYNTNHMAECLINNYNQVITSKDDLVIFVGDMFFCDWIEAKHYISKMNGRKILVKGNHDKFTNQKYLDIGFEMITDTLNLEIEGTKIKVCHYPYSDFDPFYQKGNMAPAKYPKFQPDEILIHGHTHSKTTVQIEQNMIHVGVDSNNQTPVMWDQIVEYVKQIKEYKNI